MKVQWPVSALLAALLTVPAPVPATMASSPTAVRAAAGAIMLTPSRPSPQLVGTPITWTATVSSSTPLDYRFGVAPTAGGPFTVTRDFSPRNSFVWTPMQEGSYAVQVTVALGYGRPALGSKVVPYTVASRVSAGKAVVSAIANPLVALYSAPPCSAGLVMVKFQQQGSSTWGNTTAQPCVSGLSRNFLIAGMLPSTTYTMVNVVLDAGPPITSTPLSFTTGATPSSLVLPPVSVPHPPSTGSDTAENLLVHMLLTTPSSQAANPFATDLQGRLVWYVTQPDLTNVWALRIEQASGQSGSVVYLLGDDGQQAHTDNVLRTIDLAGDPLQETNSQAINAQLRAQGQRSIYGFSHDALGLPNGDTAVIAYTEETITSTPIMGDMLIVLDRNFQVAWTWDAFQHLDPYRGPTLGDTCGQSYYYCPVPGGPNTIDWTHANAVDYTPADGDLILSLRDQDWVLKINYADGAGDGSVLWRLGNGGDYTLVPLSKADPYPWFSHQHDVNYIDSSTLELFDNANTRCATLPPPCDSRGQVYTIDEQTRVVTQTVNVDLGNYSSGFGTAQRLSNGTFNFTSGAQLIPPPPYAQDIEVLPTGAKVYVQQITVLEYRAWRLAEIDGSINPPLSP